MPGGTPTRTGTISGAHTDGEGDVTFFTITQGGVDTIVNVPKANGNDRTILDAAADGTTILEFDTKLTSGKITLGGCQDSCRLDYSTHVPVLASISGKGLRVTVFTRDQSLGSALQRSGWRARAFS